MALQLKWLSIACLFLSASLAYGQAGGTLTNGNATYTLGIAPTTETSTAPAGVSFRPEGGTTLNHLFQNWWYYRVAGDTRERPFGIYTNSAGGAITGTSNYTGNVATYSHTETDAALNTRFTTVNTITLTDSPTAGSAVVTHSMAVTNPGAAPLTISLFNYADFDVNGSSGTDTAAGGLGAITIVDGPSTAVWTGVAPNAFQVTAFATLRGLLLNANIDNLNNTGLPFGPGDFTGGYQWDLTIAPGTTVTLLGTLSINPVAVPEVSTLLMAGSLSTMLVGAVAYRRRRRTKRRFARA